MDRAKNLEKAIKTKEEEVRAAVAHLKAMEGTEDALGIVKARKAARRAQNDLGALRRAYKAATYQPPEPTDQEELLEGLKQYEKEWQERIDKIQASIDQAKEEAKRIEEGLQQAAQDADAQKTLELSAKRDEIQAALKSLPEMLQRAKEIPVYPDGVVRNEWFSICERVRPEIENRIAELQAIAEAYKEAAESLIAMNSTLTGVRRTMQGKAGETFPVVLMLGKKSESLVISPRYVSRVSAVVDGGISRPL